MSNLSNLTICDIVYTDLEDRLMFNNRHCIICTGVLVSGINHEPSSCYGGVCFDRAARAQKNGYFKNEIVPVKTKITDKDGKERSITVSYLYTVRIVSAVATLSGNQCQ